MVLQARKSKGKVLAYSVFGKDSLPSSDIALFAVSSHGGRKGPEISLGSLFIKALIPFRRVLPS